MLPDTSNVKDGEFELWPAGWYNVVLHFAEEQTAKDGKEYLNVQFKNASGRIIFDKFYYQDNCLWKLKALKKAIGVPDEEKRIEPSFGKCLQIKVAVREYKGEDQNEVKRYKPAEGEPVATPKPDPDKPPVKIDDGGDLPF
jgi:hypothetical protein